MPAYPCFVENGVLRTSQAGYDAIKAELEKRGQNAVAPIAWGCQVRVVSDEEIARLEAEAEACRERASL